MNRLPELMRITITLNLGSRLSSIFYFIPNPLYYLCLIFVSYKDKCRLQISTCQVIKFASMNPRLLVGPGTLDK